MDEPEGAHAVGSTTTTTTTFSPSYRPLYNKACVQLRQNLFIFPLVSGFAWFVTLAVLLVRWIALGRPVFPYQSNPYVAFISDIAAFHLKPFFITGCIITGLSFVGTFTSLHYVCYSSRFLGSTTTPNGRRHTWRDLASVLALLTSVVAAVSLILLSIFDTVRAPVRHRFLLLSTFGGLGVTGLATAAVWADHSLVKTVEKNGTAGFRVRRWCWINLALMLSQVLLGIVFTVCLYLGWMRPAGITEWVVTFLGAVWLLSYGGFLRAVHEAYYIADKSTERQPLLR